jgi:small subunit ribosomal protein S17
MNKKIGKVVFIKDHVTARVSVEKKSRHPKYQKVTRSEKSFLCQMNTDGVSVNDVVEIQPCAPISKCKSHKIVSVVRKSQI